MTELSTFKIKEVGIRFRKIYYSSKNNSQFMKTLDANTIYYYKDSRSFDNYIFLILERLEETEVGIL